MFTYAVIGTGAIGGYYGGRLANAGKSVQFLARSDADFIRANGLKVTSPQGDFHLDNVKVYKSAAEMEPVDVVILSLKTTANKNIPELISPLIRKGTIILLLQNGLGMEDEVAEWFPDSRIIGGMCFICSQKRAPGLITHLDYGAITIGAYCDEDKAILAQLENELISSKIPIDVADNLGEARWRKLLWNIPYNGLSVLLESNTREIMEHSSSRQIIKRLMEEVVEGAAACGYKLGESEIERMLDYTDKMTPYEPSMKLDHDNNRPMELEFMYRRPVSAAEKNGYSMEYTSMMCRQLEYIDSRNLSGGK